MREREGALGDLEGEIRARQTDLHQLKLEETQIEKQNEILRQQLDRQIADRWILKQTNIIFFGFGYGRKGRSTWFSVQMKK